MNIKYVMPLASIVLLFIGGTGRLADRSPMRVMSATPTPHPTQVQSPILSDEGQVYDDEDNDNPHENDDDLDALDDQDAPDTDTEVNETEVNGTEVNDDDASLKAEPADSVNDQEDDQGAPDIDVEDDKDQDDKDQDDKDQDIEAATASPTPVSQPALTAADAQRIAEARVNMGRARKVELDEEYGQFVYKVKIGDTKVQIDAQTGVVLKIED